MTVIVTAGHINHGKTTLVTALTGQPGDRLQVRGQRARTIDLGFSPMTLDDGEQVSIVDVPGHERYINNAIDGILPASACMLVVSAKEGWSEQTEQHTQVLTAIGDKPVLIVVTQADRCDPAPVLEQAGRALDRLDINAVWRGAVSGATGQGIPGLREAIHNVHRQHLPPRSGRVRVWIDRCFSVRGLGTVVTTTLSSGSLRVGDTLEATSGLRVRVRTLHTFGEDQARVQAATRVALNIPGVHRDDVPRGSWLVTPDSWSMTNTFDAALRGELDRQREATLNVGGSRTRCKLRPLGNTHVRVTLEQALPLQVLDRFILRIDALNQPIVGGNIVELDPRPLSRAWTARQRAEQLSTTDTTTIQTLLDSIGAARSQTLPDRQGGDLGPRRGGWTFNPNALRRWSLAAECALSETRAVRIEELLAEQGIPDRECLTLLELPKKAVATDGVLQYQSVVRAATYATLLARLTADPFDAPLRSHLASLGVSGGQLVELAADPAFLILPDSVVLGAAALREAIERLQRLTQPFTASSAREAFATSRRTTLALLQYLDETGHTQRLADGRRLTAPTKEGDGECPISG